MESFLWSLWELADERLKGIGSMILTAYTFQELSLGSTVLQSQMTEERWIFILAALQRNRPITNHPSQESFTRFRNHIF